MLNVRETFGEIDIYLFDQILKGSFDVNRSILDAGCGGGRNLVYFLRSGYEVFAVDENPQAIEQVRLLAKTLNPILPPENFQVSTVEKMPFPDERFDVVISNAVLHFASDKRHFYQMIGEMWRVSVTYKQLKLSKIELDLNDAKCARNVRRDRYLSV